MDNQDELIGKFTKTISVIHAAILIGLTLFTTAIFYITESWNFAINIDLLSIISLSMLFSSFFIGNKLYNNFLEVAKSKPSIKEKLTGLQIAFIIQLALLEGAGMLNVVFGMVTKNSFFLIISIAVIILLYTQKLTKSGIEKALEIY